MADRRRRRRAATRRRVVVLGAAGVVAAAGGTAWAMNGGGGSVYRLATAQRADITQTVDADGTLAAANRSTVSFAADGTVDAVDVQVGDHVHAGDTLAELDGRDLQAAITSARATLAEARQRLADDEAAQLSGDSSSDSSSSASTPAATPASSSPAAPASSSADAQLTSATTPIGASDVRAAQQAVEDAQRALDAAIAQVTADVDAAGSACTDDTAGATTRTVTADDDGTAAGTVDSTPVYATLLGADTTSTNPQQIAAGGSFRFAGLTAGVSYQVALVPRVDSADCGGAFASLKDDQSGKANPVSVTNAKAALVKAIANLDAVVAALASGDGSTPTQPTSPSAPQSPSAPASSPTVEPSPSGTSTPSSGDSTVSAARIAADTLAIDAARAELSVARHERRDARLTAPISGTVAAVGLAAGDVVSASSSSATITVVGTGTPSVQVDIGIADIDLVRVGQHVKVTVDGRSAPLAATVSYVGGLNDADSSGSSSTYPVTITLTGRDAQLFDGMGATAEIDVGRAAAVLSVPVSAVHTTGGMHTVLVYSSGKTTTKQVTLGVEGDERVQIKSGLSAGDRVVLADVSAAVPSDGSSGDGNRLGGLSGIGGNGPVVFNGPPPGK